MVCVSFSLNLSTGKFAKQSSKGEGVRHENIKVFISITPPLAQRPTELIMAGVPISYLSIRYTQQPMRIGTIIIHVDHL
jgi:hypothetical protein